MERYFITDPSYYDSLESFEKYLKLVYKNHCIDLSCFRDKVNMDTISYRELFFKISQEFNIKKILLNSYIDTRFFGVHLTSKQYDLIQKAKEKNLFTIASCHNKKDIQIVKKLGGDAITYSPIFSSPNKGKPKGIIELKKAIKLATPMKCFALGGIISEEQIKKIKKTNCSGFASIRYFV